MKSLITKNHPIAVPAPLNEILSARLHSEDGGQKYELQLKLADGFEPETLPGLLTDFVAAVKSRDKAIKKSKAVAAEVARKAKAERDARIAAQLEKESLEQARQVRRQSFLQAKDRKLDLAFDAATMWSTPNVEHALRVAGNVPQMQFAGWFETQTYVGGGAGHATQRNYAFLDPEHVGATICPECGNASVKTTVSHSSGRVHKACSAAGCKFFSNEVPQAPRSFVREAGRGVQLVG